MCESLLSFLPLSFIIMRSNVLIGELNTVLTVHSRDPFLLTNDRYTSFVTLS